MSVTGSGAPQGEMEFTAARTSFMEFRKIEAALV